MSWLADRILHYRYAMEDGSVRHVKEKAATDMPETYTFEDGEIGKYNGVEPDPMKQKHVVEFEKNGRKAVRIRDENGNIKHVAKSKLHYHKTGKVDPEAGYTREYKEHLQKTQQEEMLRAEHERKKRGRVSQASASEQNVEDKIAKLPDGEYLSDGVNVFKAPKQN